MQKIYNINSEYINTKYFTEPLTIKVLTSGYIGTWTGSTGISQGEVYMSKNNGNWITLTTSKNGRNISVAAGDIIKFKGASNMEFTTPYDASPAATFNVSGNLLSWVTVNYLDYYPNTNDVYYSNYVQNASNLFSNTGVISAENLIIPYCSTPWWCLNMFSDSSLEIPPKYFVYNNGIHNGSPIVITDMFARCLLSKLPNTPYTGLTGGNSNSVAFYQSNILSPVKTNIYSYPYIVPGGNNSPKLFANNCITDNSDFQYNKVYYTNLY